MTQTSPRVDHVVSRDHVVFNFGPHMKPVLEVEPGAVVVFETNDCLRERLGSLISTDDDSARYSRAEDLY